MLPRLQPRGKALGGVEGVYSTELFSKRAETLIERHETDKPLFLYFAPTNCHGEVQAPRELLEAKEPTLGSVPNHARRIYAACLLALDNSVERIEGALQARDMWATTVLLATSDNGAVPMEVLNTQAGSNWPLRARSSARTRAAPRCPRSSTRRCCRPRRAARRTRGSSTSSTSRRRCSTACCARAARWRVGARGARRRLVRPVARALLGAAPPPRDVVLYSIGSCLSGGSIIGAIRQGDLKLIVRELNQTWWPVPRTNAPADRFYEAFEVGDTPVPVQLYNLSADPTESRDLSGAGCRTRSALNATLQRYADGMSDASRATSPPTTSTSPSGRSAAVSPWLGDPLYMYACSAAICPPGAPTGAPTTLSERTPRPTSDTAMPRRSRAQREARATRRSTRRAGRRGRPRARLRRRRPRGPVRAAPGPFRCRLLCLPGDVRI